MINWFEVCKTESIFFLKKKFWPKNQTTQKLKINKNPSFFTATTNTASEEVLHVYTSASL